MQKWWYIGIIGQSPGLTEQWHSDFYESEIWNGVWGRGCDEAEISEEKRLFTE